MSQHRRSLNHLPRLLLLYWVHRRARHPWLVLRGSNVFTEDVRFFSVIGNADFIFQKLPWKISLLILFRIASCYVFWRLFPPLHAQRAPPSSCLLSVAHECVCVAWNQSRCGKFDSLLWWVSIWIFLSGLYLKSYLLNVTGSTLMKKDINTVHLVINNADSNTHLVMKQIPAERLQEQLPGHALAGNYIVEHTYLKNM